ncbi:recombinase zinc beta ribbon domain-containing protein [Streptomyces cucumeris]|uniref:recombinase zinc beta ribbon domain-containing protein n=1 Tax=Streptomyces cucumeris TaxID=2962890 RepID=UPI003D756A18
MARLYGFEDAAHRRVIEKEAVGIRGAASRRLAQQSYAAISAWMKVEGYLSTRGKEMRPDVVANILDHPAIAGLEEDENGQLVPTGGPAIIPPDDFIAIRAMRPSNKSDTQRADQREYLVPGLLGGCGLCGGSLGSSPSNSGSRGYRCSPSTAQHSGGCGRVRINADLFEKYLAEHVLAELAKPEVSSLISRAREQVLAEAAALRKRAEADRRRQTQLGDDFAKSRDLSLKAFKAADKTLTEQIRESSTRARFLEQVKSVPVGNVTDLIRWWTHAPMTAQRGVLILLLERVDVYPAASRGSRTVDSERVALTWRKWNTTEV